MTQLKRVDENAWANVGGMLESIERRLEQVTDLLATADWESQIQTSAHKNAV